jgi:hypothetical protein
MDVVNRISKTIRSVTKSALTPAVPADKNLHYAAFAIFGASALYIFYRGQIATLGLAVGVALILYVLTNNNLAVALIAGSLAGLLAVHYSRQGAEGFEDTATAATAATTAAEGEKEKEKEAAAAEEKPAIPEGFARNGKKVPDNGERAEFFELGKKYTGPKEEDDGDFHLDAGTTFMNAYKSLKPDQIAAMTKDTQELMATQKQLMNTLGTLKPLIQDGKQMMDMFQGYFGSGGLSMPSLKPTTA